MAFSLISFARIKRMPFFGRSVCMLKRSINDISDISLRRSKTDWGKIICSQSRNSMIRHIENTRREKVIAHNELLSSEPAPDLTWAQVNSLLELARTMLDLVSSGYLNYFLTADDGSFFLTSEVEQSAVCLRRLLRSLK